MAHGSASGRLAYDGQTFSLLENPDGFLLAELRLLYLRHFDAGLISAADGVNSLVGKKFAERFQPDIDVRECRHIWLGPHLKLDALTFITEPSGWGWFQVRAYRFDRDKDRKLNATSRSIFASGRTCRSPIYCGKASKTSRLPQRRPARRDDFRRLGGFTDVLESSSRWRPR